MQLRAPSAQALVAAPQAHSLQDLRGRAHPASRLAHGQASGARHRRLGTCAGCRRRRHAEPAH
eukprot:15347421-Alexandrium_andersonii.AAC.1